MFSIARLENLRVETRNLLDEQERELAAKPESPFRQMLVESTKARLDDLTQQLIQERERRTVEVVEIHLTGQAAYFGTLPTHILGPITESFTEMIVQAGRFVRHGSRGSFTEIRNQFDIRLNRMASGSTRLFYTVRATPDLFGTSLSEEALHRTFGVLSVESPEQIINQVARYGKPSVRGLVHFLKTLHEAHLEARLNWVTPTDSEQNWEGTTERISQLKATLESIISDEPQEVTFSGTMFTESIRGKFEVKTRAGTIYSGTVPQVVMPSLLAVSVGDDCQGVLLETVTRNRTTGAEKRLYELKSIEPAHRTRAAKPAQLPLPF